MGESAKASSRHNGKLPCISANILLEWDELHTNLDEQNGVRGRGSPVQAHLGEEGTRRNKEEAEKEVAEGDGGRIWIVFETDGVAHDLWQLSNIRWKVVFVFDTEGHRTSRASLDLRIVLLGISSVSGDVSRDLLLVNLFCRRLLRRLDLWCLRGTVGLPAAEPIEESRHVKGRRWSRQRDKESTLAYEEHDYIQRELFLESCVCLQGALSRNS